MKVITLNKNDFSSNCKLLIHKVGKQPDLIVGILNGGGYVTSGIKKVKGLEGIQYKSIKLQRVGEQKKQQYIFKSLLKILPYKLLNKLRIIESKKAIKAIEVLNLDELSKTKIDFEIETNSKEQINTILVVDDAIDTGRTMFIIKNNLKKMFPKSEIKTAVISWTIEKSIVVPDYYIYKNTLVRFPWSKDYKGNDFE